MQNELDCQLFANIWDNYESQSACHSLKTFKAKICVFFFNILRLVVSYVFHMFQNEPDSHLPRITGSLFLSPGGEKFIQLLLHFSRYVLQQDIERMGMYHVNA